MIVMHYGHKYKCRHCINFFLYFSSTPNRETLHELLSNGHRLALEVISVHSHTVHVLSSTHNPASLQHAGLSGCTLIASAQDLFRNELAQNWHKLQENLGEWVRSALVEDLLLQGQTPCVVRRSLGNRECVLTGKCDGQEDHWFTEYVSVRMLPVLAIYNVM